MMPHGSGAPIAMYANHCYQRQMEASGSLETKRESWSSELGMRPEELVDAAYAITKDVDPELLATVREPQVSGYASKQGIEALLSLLLQKVLIERPEDPVAYLINVLKEWSPRMVVTLGPPASGKYTLASLLAERLASRGARFLQVARD